MFFFIYKASRRLYKLYLVVLQLLQLPIRNLLFRFMVVFSDLSESCKILLHCLTFTHGGDKCYS